MKYLSFCFLLCCLIGLALADNIGDYSEDTTGSDDPHAQVYRIYDDVDLVPTLKFYYAKPKITVKSVYPQLFSANEDNYLDTFNTMVTDLVQQEIDNFKNRVAQFSPAKSEKNNLYIDYSTSSLKSGDQHIISLRFTIQGVIGGTTRPYHYHDVINYSVEENRSLELNELFKSDIDYLDVLSKYSIYVLSRRLGKNFLPQGAAALSDNFKNWNIKPNGILITFDESQVAPSIQGTQTVLVPFSMIKKIIAPDAPIAGCVKRQKKCAYSNILTGGFIDEAKLKKDISPIDLPHGSLNPTLGKL